MNDSIFHRLYEMYHQDLFKFLIYLTRNRSHAEDLTHEVYVKVLRSYTNFKGQSSEKTWLFSIAKNVAIDYFRKNAVRQKHAFDKFDWEKSELVSASSLPDDLVVMNEETQEVLNALDACTGNQKMVIQMRFIQELSIAETADVLGWTLAKVKTTQHRAIQSLKEKLVQTGKGGNDNG